MKIDSVTTRPEAAEPAAPGPARPIPGGDRLALWCGWVMIGAAVLTPLLAYLSTMAFSALLALTGLLCLPALRRPRQPDWRLLAPLAALILWAAVSVLWSPYRAKHFATDTPVQLALALPFGWSAICGARRADRRLARRAVEILSWGLALLGLLLIREALSGAKIYQWLEVTFYRPIRSDFAQRNVGDTALILTLLWPLCLGAARRWRDAALAAPMAVGAAMAAHAFQADAPVIAAPLALLVAFAVWRAPRLAPTLLAGAVVVVWELTPLILIGVRATGRYPELIQHAPPSWAWRLVFWSRAVDWVRQHPFRGWGLDASRVLGEGVALHPHNGALQVWLELGVLGAILAAAFWASLFLRLVRERPSWTVAGQAATACVFLLYANANFGAWQAWFYSLGAMAMVFAAARAEAEPPP